jgi:hypothetical protein
MSKRALSAEMRNAIVWLERQPGVTSVVQGRYNATRHHHDPGFARVRIANERDVHVVVYDKGGVKDLFVYAPTSAVRDRWIAALATGKPFNANGTGPDIVSAKVKAVTQQAVVTKHAAAARLKPEPNAVMTQAPVQVPDQVVNLQAAQLYNVTPELATFWLERNTRNRKLRQSVVNKYAADMRNGRWLVTGDAIAFDTHDAIVNGQHRLYAVFESGVTVQMHVAFNLDPDVVAVLDDHLKRNMADVAGIARPGTTVSSLHAAIANMLLQTSILATAVDRRQALERVTRQAQLDTMDRHWEAIEFTFRECFRSAKMRSITVASVLTPMARAYYTQDHDRLRAFGKVMLNGMTDTPTTDKPAILLRNYLLKYAAGGTRPTADVIYRKTERALAAFLEGSSLSTLYEANVELFPLPEDSRPKGRK